jgi:hypothetical protein
MYCCLITLPSKLQLTLASITISVVWSEVGEQWIACNLGQNALGELWCYIAYDMVRKGNNWMIDVPNSQSF